MPFIAQRKPLDLNDTKKVMLTKISNSRTEPLRRVERATILLQYAEKKTVSFIARFLKTNRPKVERCVDKALQFGVETALDDLPRSGKTATITEAAKAWIISLACQKPKDIGYSYETWTNRLLMKHIRGHCVEVGHPCLSNLSRGTVSKILSKAEIRPHKINYYLERRDPNFDEIMAQVLLIYQEVAILRKESKDKETLSAYLSFDEKPGIQALENLAPDLNPQSGKYPSISRDHQYKRHGTLSLMSGIDLLTGYVHGHVVKRHRSKEFIEFLKKVNIYYANKEKIRIILDNHSAHISKETKKYLATVPNRFEFVFTPKHGSWLNLIETFFSKMTRTVLRHIRVSSIQELKLRLLKFLEEVNESPVIFKWKYGIENV